MFKNVLPTLKRYPEVKQMTINYTTNRHPDSIDDEWLEIRTSVTSNHFKYEMKLWKQYPSQKGNIDFYAKPVWKINELYQISSG